jgi:Gas vesicle synthesis protein GvpL/GvpF
MPVIPYCILLQYRSPSVPVTGIGDSHIQKLSEGELVALYSELEKVDISPKSLQSAALEFHRVVRTVFEQVAVVPFRFPTWLTQPELIKHLQEESQRYRAFLTSHANHVQMEARVAFAASNSTKIAATSGTAHLRARAAEARRLRGTAEILRNLLASEVVEWRERETPAGLRLYALVDRSHTADFRERLSRQEHEINVRWSGPWPATEFLESPRRSEP